MIKQAIVNSLKRLYISGRVNKEKLRSMVEKGQINSNDYKEITGDNYA